MTAHESPVDLPTGAGAGSTARAGVSLVGLAISVVALAGVLIWALRQGRPSVPTNPAALLAVVAAIAVYAAATAARAERWLLLLRRIGATPTRADAYGLTLVSYMGNNVLPARGGDLLRIYLAAPRAATGKRQVIGSVIAERILDVVTLLGIFVVLAYAVLRGVYAPEAWHAAVAAAAGAVLLAAAFAGAAVARRRRLFERVRAFVRPMLSSSRSLRGRHGAGLVALTLAIWALEAGTYYAVAVSVDIDITPLEALYLVALAGLFVALPAGPGNVGTLDAGIVVGATALGATGDAALAFLLMLRVVLFVPVTVAGLVVLLARYGGRPSIRSVRALASRG
jgi:glycosyltransferase 2 family protein